MSNRNRTAGHNWELICVQSMKAMDFPDAKTSRFANREADGFGIDLTNTGNFQIQCKNTTNIPDLKSIFKKMKAYAEDKYNCIFWKKTKRANKHFVTEGEYVIMPLQDWFKMIQDINENGL